MTEAYDPIITINDIRATQHCVRGARRWFEAHGLNFVEFVDKGLPASVLLATGDTLAFQVVEAREKRDHNG